MPDPMSAAPVPTLLRYRRLRGRLRALIRLLLRTSRQWLDNAKPKEQREEHKRKVLHCVPLNR